MTEQVANSSARRLGETSAALSASLNKWVEWLCAAIMAALVLVVGIGIFGRYVMEIFSVTWSEELARYLMIWVALLAVSSGVARREHVAVIVVLERIPHHARKMIRAAIDGLAFAFFAFLCYFGIDMTQQGATQYATIFEMTMWIPFAAVPVSSALVCVQLLLAGVRDFTLIENPVMIVGETK
ncbi:MAG: TRAP transporter small permease [Gammaproteobacteria bacterium]|nr:TRAP transporter small permease [Gammaproteobacteria bacterium]MBU4004654.1 TRAP transporter small permease [Gammaproteobacteria bacterium]MBU4021257.1 TRAP transporter small permease [Gammaproteobacteria bacterium]MBU4096274.1 TRAP transporter small permease [Gammaproteobacteria bacterium]MBU4145751.1 TRAP transporter small permease [Gammaproteobacteria bacterium]